MTATDPRPELAAKLAAGLAPAAEALALAYAEDMSAGPPPPDDRALAERHRAGRAQLSHLRQLLAVLDWAAPTCPNRSLPLSRNRKKSPGSRRPPSNPITTAARTSSTMAARPMSAARKRPSSGRGWKTWSAASGRSRSTTAARAA